MAETLISPTDYDAVSAAALSLPYEDRVMLLDHLAESLEGSEQLSPEWLAIIKRRLEEVKSGKVGLIDGEEVQRRARERVGL